MTAAVPPSKADVRRTYDRIAESFAERRREPWPEVSAFAEGLRAGLRVLDVGCGHGRHTAFLAARGLRVVGIDLSARLLQIARAASPGWHSLHPPAWIEADASALPLRSGSVDACLCIAVVHHLPTPADRLAALTEIRRTLVPGGELLMSVWALDPPRGRGSREGDRGTPRPAPHDVGMPWSLPDGTKVVRYYHLFEEDEFRSLIIDSGLREETFFKASENLFVRARRA
ncbi:MAG: class I SAM-dependent methyltransferase [Methanobacteriota archaeon]